MKREVIDTDRAPHTGMPYAQAVRYGNLVFVAGQVALDPATAKPTGGDIAAQTRRVLDNITAILEEAGTSLQYALDSLDPPRTTVEAAMPREQFLVEIRIIAGMPDYQR